MQTTFNKKLIFPMMLGSILNPINSSMISIALVPIAFAFGVGSAETAWLVSALYFVTAIGQPVVGKLIDFYGPRKLFLTGTILVGIAGIIALMTPVFWLLIVARVILGLGTTAGYPAAMYLIKSEGRRTGNDNPAGILKVLVITNQTIAVIGPTLGGFLIHLGGWRLIFSINIPLAIITFIAGFLVLPKLQKNEVKMQMDWLGVLYFSFAIFGILFFLMRPNLLHLIFLAIAVLFAFLFVKRENNIIEPFINLQVLKGNRSLIRTYIRVLLMATVQYCFIYGFAQWLENGRGLTAALAGILMVPTFIFSTITSAVIGRGKKYFVKMLVGGLIQFTAILLLTFTNSNSSFLFLGLIGAGFGITTGILSLANQNVLYFQADPETIGASSGLLRTFMYFGAMLAGVVNGALLDHSHITTGIHELAYLNLAFSLIFIVLTLYDKNNLQHLKGSSK